MPIPAIESLSKESIKIFQEVKLKEALHYLNSKSPYYSNLFKTHGIDISQIKEIEDLCKIPVTTKHDLQERNSEFLCVDKVKIIDYVTTSGTSGEPVTFAMTDKDLDRLAYNEYLSFLCANGTKTDIYQLTATMDRMFMAGLAYFLGARKLGAGIIRVGSGSPELQWDTIHKMQPTAIIGVPSFLLKLIEYAQHNNIDNSASTIKTAICIGEPLRDPDFNLNSLGKRIHENWDLKLYSTYASTEMGTAFTECAEGLGGHHHPELIIVEFLDENNNPVSEHEAGEITVTTLGMEGMPLLRFKTGDVCHRYYGKCGCGRNT
ncbi:MAG TPA: AMP-binding protein, partial [Cytophagaceae bacterium]